MAPFLRKRTASFPRPLLSGCSLALVIFIGLWVQFQMRVSPPQSIGRVEGSKDTAPSSPPFSVTGFLRDAYQRSYAHMVECPPRKRFGSCRSESINNVTRTAPWWYRTVLSTRHLDGNWHFLTNGEHRLRMCTIEKVGTSSWRKVFCALNGSHYEGPRWDPCYHAKPELTSELNVSQFVFLRDPLERFLSGFIDKCINNVATQEYCSALEFFRKPPAAFAGSKRSLFEAFVETSPLRWDVHFAPQSLYCDGLYRRIDEYAFLGRMDAHFYRNLQELGRAIPPLQSALEDVFEVSKKLAQNASASSHNRGHATQAHEHLKEYYTAGTIQRVLEYMSIDYLLLNMTVPAWAEEILMEDHSDIKRAKL